MQTITYVPVWTTSSVASLLLARVVGQGLVPQPQEEGSEGQEGGFQRRREESFLAKTVTTQAQPGGGPGPWEMRGLSPHPALPWCHPQHGPRCDLGFWHTRLRLSFPLRESGLNLPSNRRATVPRKLSPRR